MSRVIVLGFDAAEPELVNRWVSQGHLPNFARLQREGAGGRLASTVLPLSPVAWSTAITGMNPGNHGVYDWHERDPQTYHQRMVSASSIKAKTLWQRANDAGLTCGVMNVPLTYPPRPLDGWLISGILTPPSAAAFTFPTDLRAELEAACGKYRVFFGATYREGEERAYLDSMHDTIEQRRKTLLHLMQTHPTDLLFAVFMESDHVMHDFWKYMDPAHPSHRPGYRQFEHAIRDVYRHLDDVLGDVLSAIDDDSTLFVLSDHGSGPYHGHVFVNKYLIQNGLLALRRGMATRLKLWLAKHKTPERIYGFLRSLGIDLRPLVPKSIRQKVVASGIGSSDIDWRHTQAYGCGDYGQIAVNLAGREGQGSVDPRDREAVVEQVCTLLENMVDEEGDPLVAQIWRAENLYHGAYVHEAPDVLFTMRDYLYQSSLDPGLHVPGLVEAARFSRGETSGSHRPYGILYALGPGVRPGTTVDEMDLSQLTPTALYSLGLPVPNQLDGQVIAALFEPEHLQAHPIRYVDEEASETAPPESAYTEEDTALIEERLRNLGYLE
jgi:predicted AlkP superfamily phosphohydrolase/phosphomutase